MVTTRSQHAKRQDGFKSLPPLLKKIKVRANKAPVSKPAKNRITVHDFRLRHLYLEAKCKHRERLKRLQLLYLGRNRVFSGSVHIPDPITARQCDAQRLSSIQGLISFGLAAVYWVDGSAREGYLGAGVVWQDQYHNITAQYKLGRYTGNAEDAEVFAIAAALGRAKKKVERNKNIRIVRIFSDAQAVLQALEKGMNTHSGPMLTKKTALEGLYERADTLKAQGVVVELVWVKGHSESQDNCLADKAANGAVGEQIDQDSHVPAPTIPATLADVPDIWHEMGPDWVEKWLYCANVHLHHKSTKSQGRLRKPLAISHRGPLQKRAQQSRKAPTVTYTSIINNTQYGFILPELGLYGNLTIDQIIASLYNQRELVDYQISEVQRLIVSTIGENVVEYLKSNVAELFVKRDGINEEIEAQLVVQRLGNRAEVDEEERWVGDVLLMKLDTLLGADDQLEEFDTDEKLERQIREDIALAQRYM